MNKILMEVTSPAAGKTYDIRVPASMQVGEIIRLLGSVFMQTSNGVYLFEGNGTLCEKNTGEILEVNASIEELNIKNGTKLLFI